MPDETLTEDQEGPEQSQGPPTLDAIFDLGGMKVVDQQLTDFLMVEFLRLRTMLGEDLLHNVRSYHSKILKCSYSSWRMT